MQEIMTEMVNLTDKLKLSDCTTPEFTLQAAIAAVFPAEYRTTGYQALQEVIGSPNLLQQDGICVGTRRHLDCIVAAVLAFRLGPVVLQHTIPLAVGGGIRDTQPNQDEDPDDPLGLAKWKSGKQRLLPPGITARLTTPARWVLYVIERLT